MIQGDPTFGHNPLQQIRNRTVTPLFTNWTDIGNAVGGAIFTYLLLACRWRHIGFFLHPIGLAVGASYAMHHIWSSLLVGWVVKSAITHWGGVQWYRRLRPFFMGLVVGDYLSALIWIVVGALTRTPYRLLPVP
jgi:hypothetical protein